MQRTINYLLQNFTCSPDTYFRRTTSFQSLSYFLYFILFRKLKLFVADLQQISFFRCKFIWNYGFRSGWISLQTIKPLLIPFLILLLIPFFLVAWLLPFLYYFGCPLYSNFQISLIWILIPFKRSWKWNDIFLNFD